MRQENKPSGVSPSFCHYLPSVLHDSVAHATPSGVTYTVSRHVLTSALLNWLLPPPTFAVFFHFPADQFSLSNFGRFAGFVLGSPHVSPAETKAHDEEYGIGSSFLEEQLFETRTESEQDETTSYIHEGDDENEDEIHEPISFPYATELLWALQTTLKKGREGKTCSSLRERLQTQNSLLVISCGCLGTNKHVSNTVSCINDIAQLEQQKETMGTAQAKRISHHQYFSWEALLISRAGTDSSPSHHNAFFCQGYYL